MAWIESNEELATHPKTKRAARLLGVSIPTIIGHLHLLWWWCLKYAQDGDITKFESADIAEGAGWEGDPEKFINSLLRSGPGNKAGFLDKDEEGHLLVHDWWDYAGRLVEKRQANAARMRDSRKTKKERATHVQDTTEARAGATVPNPTVPNHTEPINDDVDITREEEDNSSDVQEESLPVGIQAIRYAEATWGRMIPPGESESIVRWCDEFKSLGSTDPDSMVIEAIKRALEQNVRKLAYVNTILQDWFLNGIKSVEHIKSLDAEWKAQKDRGKENRKGPKGPSDKPPGKGKYDNFYL